MKFLSTFILGFILMVNVFADTKRVFTFEDFFALKRLSNLKASITGNYLSVEVTTPDIEENVLDKSVLIMKPNGDIIQEFGSKKEKVKKPYISNDEKYVYFVKEKQIWRMQIDGSMPKQVTDIHSGVKNFKFSPKENYILIESDVKPVGTTQDCINSEGDNKPKVEARIYDHLMYRHWNEWRDDTRKHLLLFSVKDKTIKDLTPGSFDTPPIALGSSHDYAFSPDEKEISFVSNHDPVVAISTNNDVFTLSLAGGELQKISKSKGNDTYPVYSPDGKYIAFLSMERAGFEADQKRIYIYNRNSKSLENLMTDLEFSAEEILWSADSKTIYFSAQQKGYVPLFKLDVDSKKISQIVDKHFIKNISFSGKNNVLFLSQSAQSPYEIYSLNLNNNKVEKISSINDALLSMLELPQFEEFWFDGANEDKVHGFIMKPPFFEKGKKYPAIEIIHGGPQGMMGDKFHYRWNTQMFAAPGNVVFWINFHGSTGYGQKFTDAISQHWGDLPFEDIIKGTQFVIDNYEYVDANRISAAGASYGGTMINWICGHENPFKALVSHDGVYDQRSMWGATEELWFPEWELGGLPWDENSLYEKWSPARLAGNFKTPTLVIHGELDYRVPYTQGLQMFTALQRQGVPSRLLFFPDEDHWVMKPQNARLWWKTVHEWIAKYTI
jgi:dipeptidyl aminopeptidase/acylaminoacyl peptidase